MASGMLNEWHTRKTMPEIRGRDMTALKVGAISAMLGGMMMMGGSLIFFAADPQYAGVFALGGLLFLVGWIIRC